MSRVAADPDLFEVLEPDTEHSPVRLLGSYSPAADEHFWPVRRRCPLTTEPVQDVDLTPGGVVWSWSFVNVPWPGLGGLGAEEGYAVCLVDVPEGPRVMGVLFGTMEDCEIGAEVEAVAVDLMLEDEQTLCVLGFRRKDAA